jgi:hypothetical protein
MKYKCSYVKPIPKVAIIIKVMRLKNQSTNRKVLSPETNMK